MNKIILSCVIYRLQTKALLIYLFDSCNVNETSRFCDVYGAKNYVQKVQILSCIEVIRYSSFALLLKLYTQRYVFTVYSNLCDQYFTKTSSIASIIALKLAT